jgi:glycosyltransferase involved in cell wall biosynthesis
MRILTVVDLPWDARLGAVQILMELGRAWAAAGHQIAHYCLDDAFPDRTASPPRSAWRRLRFPHKVTAVVRKDGAHFDVIDAIVGALPSTKQHLNFNGLLVARSIGSHKLYRDFEKMARQRWGHPEEGKLSGRIFYTFVQHRLFRNAEQALQRCDLVNVPNEIELELLGRTKAAIIQPYGLSQQWPLHELASPETRLRQPTIAFIGMWSLRKGAGDWSEIIRRIHAALPHARFKFLGTMTDNERVFRDLNLSPCGWIEIVPEYQAAALPRLLSDATAGAFPSYAEGFGLGLLEQLAAGIPTVAYDAPGPRSILNSLPDLLVPVGDVERLSAKLIEILSADLVTYRHLVDRCREAGRRFSWPTIAVETAAQYEKHLGRVR